MITIFLRNTKYCLSKQIVRPYTTNVHEKQTGSNGFETVFSFPAVKYISTINRLKTYHIIGTCLVLPSCGLLEMLNVASDYSFLAASYIGITGIAVLSLASWPFQNTIGYLYISENNKQIKISSVNFWGKRIDRIVSVNDWIPLLEMKPRLLDSIYLSPQLVDGTKYKLFIHFGKVYNAKKIGQVLE